MYDGGRDGNDEHEEDEEEVLPLEEDIEGTGE